MKHDILITDIDNTLFNFVDFFAPSFRSMIHAISKKYNLSEDVLYDEIKNFYKETRSIEHNTTIMNLPSIAQMGEEKAGEVARLGRIVFDRTRRSLIKPYPGVIETLSELRLRGVLIIGLTNAPTYQAVWRLRQHLGIFEYFWGIAGYVGSEQKFDEFVNAQEKYDKLFKSLRRRLNFLLLLSEEQLKPSIEAFKEVISAIDLDTENIYAFGDSKSKDLSPAATLGCKTIWAKYGSVYEERNFETLKRITPWSERQISMHTGITEYEPDYEIENPTELLNIIQGTSPMLF